MKNREIIRALPQLKSLKFDLKSIDAQIKGLETQRKQLDQEIRILERVDTVIDGIAVGVEDGGATIYGTLYKIGAIADEIERSAEVYPNAHTSDQGVAKDWGVRLRGSRKAYGGLEEKWLGTGWPWKEAVETAQRWVTRGEIPDEQQQKLWLLRHQLDPDGRVTKRRRQAFEAAWLAGHFDLAKEILLGRAKMRAAAGPPKEGTASV